MNRRTLLKTGAGVIAGFLKPMRAMPRATTMRVVFGFDGSRSMYTKSESLAGQTKLHAEIQSYGHLAALKSERVRQVLVARQPYVHCVTWASGSWAREFVLPRKIIGEWDINALCNAIEKSYSSIKAPSSMSGTVHASLLSFVRKNIPAADVSILDISTDGEVYSYELRCREERDTLESDGWVVNGLAVDNSRGEVKRTVSKNVITSTGRVWQIHGWNDYVAALEEKMYSELIS